MRLRKYPSQGGLVNISAGTCVLPPRSFPAHSKENMPFEFDPVRDAVLLNSPTGEREEGTRKTHLSVLLNSDSPPKSSLSQILHAEPVAPISPATSRPSSSSSLPPTSTVSPVMRPPPLLYNPTSRLTPPTSVLTPMSKAEMEMYKTYVGKGTARLAKRKRAREDSSDPTEEPPSKKHFGNAGVVVDHCTFLCSLLFEQSNSVLL